MYSLSSKWFLIVFLFLFTCLISLIETALSRARKTKLQEWSEQGVKKAQSALDVLTHVEFFFLLLQFFLFGTTLAIGIVGFSLFEHFHLLWQEIYVSLPLFLSLVLYGLLGALLLYSYILLTKLIPRQLAFRRAEKILLAAASSLKFFFYLFYPLLSPFAVLTQKILKQFKMTLVPESLITEEEIKVLIEQGRQAGTVEEVEQDIVERVFRLADRKVSLLMIPRHDVVYLDLEDASEKNTDKILNSPYSHFPVVRGDLDNIIGTVYIKEILNSLLLQKLHPMQLEKMIYSPLFIPENVTALHLLELFKKSVVQIAFVVDEYGSFQGLITLKDILEAIVGNIPSINKEQEVLMQQREDGSWLLDGMISIEEMKSALDIDLLPQEKEGRYQTLAGFMMTLLGRIPEIGDAFTICNWRFEVVAMDGNRVHRVTVEPSPQQIAHPQFHS